MAWFMTPFGPQYVIEPGTVEEFERRDYVSLTAQQAADYFAGVAFPDPPSFATEAEVPGIVASAVSAGTGPVADALRAAFVALRPAHLVFDGDSLTAGSQSTNGRTYPAQTADGYDSRTITRNLGVGGQTMALMLGDAATEIDPLFDPTRLNAALVWGGTNDLFVSNGVVTVDTLYANTVAYHQGRRAAGYKTVAFTLLPRTSVSTPANFEAKRQDFNTRIRANWQTFADALADVAADPTMGPAGASDNTTYYADQTHPTNAGYAIIARIARNALAALGVVGAHDHFDTQRIITSLWVPASAFAPNAGPPSPIDVSRAAPTWLLDPAVNESIEASFQMPRGWTTWRADIVWANTSAGAGDVRLNLWYAPVVAGASHTATLTNTFKIATAGGNAVVQVTEMTTSSITVDPNAVAYGLRVSRSATDAADTLASDVAILGVNLRRMS